MLNTFISEDLKDALTSLKYVVKKGSSNVLLESTADGIQLTATDYTTSISVKIDAQIFSPFRIILPHKELLDFSKSFKREEISLSTEDDKVVLQTASSKLTLTKTEDQGFSEQNIEKNFTDFVLVWEAHALKTAIDLTEFSIDPQHSRPVLSGIYVETKKQNTKFVATDGYRLSVHSIDTSTSSDHTWLVPVKTMSILSKLIGKLRTDVYVYFNPNYESNYKLQFRIGSEAFPRVISVMSTLIEGTFPDYKQFIPDSLGISHVVFDVETLKTSLPVSKDSQSALVLETGKDSLMITMKVGDGLVKQTLPVETNGEDWKIALSPPYLMDVLKILPKGRATLYYNDRVKPVVITSQVERSYVHVLMPRYMDVDV